MNKSQINKINELQDMKEKGILTEEEFIEEKKKILNKKNGDKLFLLIAIVAIIALSIFIIIKIKGNSSNVTEEKNITEKEGSNRTLIAKDKNSSPQNDTDLGLSFVKIDNISKELTEEQKTVLQYFDDDYFDATDYEFLVRYPQIFENMEVRTHGVVKKTIKSDNETYELLVCVMKNKTYYQYWDNYRSGIDTPYEEYEEKNKNNYIVIKGNHGDARLIEGDWIEIYGRYEKIDSYQVDGNTYTLPTINVHNIQYDDLNSPNGQSIRFDLKFIRKVAKAIFNNAVTVREPSEEEAVITSSAFMNHPTYVCELDNQTNAKFSKYFFNRNYGYISDVRNSDDYVYAKLGESGIDRYIEFAPDFEHFFMFIYDRNDNFLTVEYYDKEFKRIWTRDFEETQTGSYDYTENNIYLVANSYLYTINTQTGEDTIEKKYVGPKFAIRKLKDSILLFEFSNVDSVAKTDLKGNILWSANVDLRNGFSGVQINNNILTICTDKYTLIDLDSGKITLNAESKNMEYPTW